MSDRATRHSSELLPTRATNAGRTDALPAMDCRHVWRDADPAGQTNGRLGRSESGTPLAQRRCVAPSATRRYGPPSWLAAATVRSQKPRGAAKRRRAVLCGGASQPSVDRPLPGSWDRFAAPRRP
jgi:hypothetical protein